MPTQIQSFTCGPVSTNCFLIICINEVQRNAVLVDAPYGCMQLVLDELQQQNVSLQAIYLTHSHWDHTADVAPLVAATGCEVYIHPLDVYRLEDPMEHTMWPLPFTIEGVKNHKPLTPGTSVNIMETTLHVLFTPGHTEGSVSFYDAERGLVYAGDTLFRESIGRTDLPGGDFLVLEQSIREQLYTLPDEVVVLPGHGNQTTIGYEKLHNPFVQVVE